MQYKNAICDGCSKPLDNEEDIVVCPVCGTPQHRECYSKEGKCVNEAKHSEGFVWQKPEPVETENSALPPENGIEEKKPVPIIISPQNVGELDRVFLDGVGSNPDEEICGGVRVRDAALFIQSGAKKYIGKFKKIKNISWNWGAFFFAPYWFFYRKLYKLGFVFLSLIIAATVMVSPLSQKASSESETLYNYISSNEIVELQKEYSENPNDEAVAAKMTEATEKMYTLAESMIKYSSIVFAVTFLIPNTVAALIADTQYRKKMSDTVKLARGISSKGQSETARFTLLKRGGVSFTAALASIVAGMYMPSLLLMLAQALAR